MRLKVNDQTNFAMLLQIKYNIVTLNIIIF